MPSNSSWGVFTKPERNHQTCVDAGNALTVSSRSGRLSSQNGAFEDRLQTSLVSIKLRLFELLRRRSLTTS